ncbi:MAG: carbamate kinase [Vampirovibrio sp.]|nr:carbamate kinase [Vampirovibrio sp.]
MKKVLIAIGGNALFDETGGNNILPAAVENVCRQIVGVVQQGYFPIITFGNGPQVGNLLNIAETTAMLFSKPIKLDTCVSWTQGELGYHIAKELRSLFAKHHIELPVVAMNTTVEVDPNDRAFEYPAKPIGRFISAEDSQKLFAEKGWIVGPDANRGHRRMVPSPAPLNIQELDAIRHLMEKEIVTLCCGGGGIPVTNTGEYYKGLEAVIDKDYTSCLLAKELQIPTLVICTNIDHVYLNFGKPDQKALKRMPLPQAQAYLEDGQFSKGSMGPKVTALIDYVQAGGERALTCRLDQLIPALAGDAGTEIYAGKPGDLEGG